MCCWLRRYAPMFPERALDDPSLNAARRAIDLVLEGQKPYPAFAIDRHWQIVASNGAIPELYEGAAASLLRPPMNALRLSLHPQGLAPRIANLSEWRTHLLARLRRQIELTADAVLVDLLGEVLEYPMPAGHGLSRSIAEEHSLVVPFKIVTKTGLLSLFSTTTVFGTPVDITLSELALEMFFPADAETTAAVRRLAGHDESAQRLAEAAE
jgi:hypothetical protein